MSTNSKASKKSRREKTQFPVLDSYGYLRRSVAQLGAAELRRIRMGTKQMGILYNLSTGAAKTSSELAENTQSDRATVSRCLTGLIREGLVSRSTDPRDRRWEILTLTAAGKRRAEKANQVRGRIEKVLAGALTAREREILPKLLDKIADAVNANTKRPAAAKEKKS